MRIKHRGNEQNNKAHEWARHLLTYSCPNKTRKHSNLYHISETMQNQQPQYYAQKLQVLSN